MRKVITVLLCLALLAALALPVLAVETPDANRLGSLTFRMEWKGEPLNSGSLTLYRVGRIDEKNGGYEFVLVPELADAEVSLENLNDTNLPGSLAKLARERKMQSVMASIKDGNVQFADMQTGLYVVTQDQPCDGMAAISSFLISLPQWDGKTYVYDLTADPKVGMETAPTETTPTETTKPSGPKLPQTGQLNWPIPVMVVTGMIFLTVGMLLCFRKKGRHET